MYYKLGQRCVIIAVALVFFTNQNKRCYRWGYYKIVKLLLKNWAAITNWYKTYYKLGQILQIRAIITNWSVTYRINLDGEQSKGTYRVSLFIHRNTAVYFDSFGIEYIPQGLLNKIKDK